MTDKENDKYQDEYRECVQLLGGLNITEMTAMLEILKAVVKKHTLNENLLIKINQYKSVLKLAGVPKLLIEYPSFIRSVPPSLEDIDWAKGKIIKNKKSKI